MYHSRPETPDYQRPGGAASFYPDWRDRSETPPLVERRSERYPRHETPHYWRQRGPDSSYSDLRNRLEPPLEERSNFSIRGMSPPRHKTPDSQWHEIPERYHSRRRDKSESPSHFEERSKQNKYSSQYENSDYQWKQRSPSPHISRRGNPETLSLVEERSHFSVQDKYSSQYETPDYEWQQRRERSHSRRRERSESPCHSEKRFKFLEQDEYPSRQESPDSEWQQRQVICYSRSRYKSESPTLIEGRFNFAVEDKYEFRQDTSDSLWQLRPERSYSQCRDRPETRSYTEEISFHDKYPSRHDVPAAQWQEGPQCSYSSWRDRPESRLHPEEMSKFSVQDHHPQEPIPHEKPKKLSGAQKRKLARLRAKEQQPAVSSGSDLQAQSKPGPPVPVDIEGFTESSLAATAEENIAVVPMDYPHVSLTSEQIGEFSEQVLAMVDRIELDGSLGCPSFRGLSVRKGGFLLTCVNQETKDWLDSIIGNIQLGHLKLRTAEPDVLGRFVRISVRFPGRFPIIPELVDNLATQNPGMRDLIQHWTVIWCKETGDGFFSIFKIPEPHVQELETRNFQLHYAETVVQVQALGNIKKKRIGSPTLPHSDAAKIRAVTSDSPCSSDKKRTTTSMSGALGKNAIQNTPPVQKVEQSGSIDEKDSSEERKPPTGFRKISAFIPNPLETIQECLQNIQLQNEGMQTGKWRVWANKTSINGRFLVAAVPESVAKVIESMNGRIYHGFHHIQVKVTPNKKVTNQNTVQEVAATDKGTREDKAAEPVPGVPDLQSTSGQGAASTVILEPKQQQSVDSDKRDRQTLEAPKTMDSGPSPGGGKEVTPTLPTGDSIAS